jgi:hypothetical protein
MMQQENWLFNISKKKKKKKKEKKKKKKTTPMNTNRSFEYGYRMNKLTCM